MTEAQWTLYLLIPKPVLTTISSNWVKHNWHTDTSLPIHITTTTAQNNMDQQQHNHSHDTFTIIIRKLIIIIISISINVHFIHTKLSPQLHITIHSILDKVGQLSGQHFDARKNSAWLIDWKKLLNIKETNKHHRRLQRDHPPVPAVISGFAKGERGLDFRIRSQPANPLQPVTYSIFTSVFSDHGYVLAGHKNNDNIVTIKLIQCSIHRVLTALQDRRN